MKALVVGASGFVGGWLVGHLIECGDEVVTTPAELDIVDRAALFEFFDANPVDVVFHLAAISSVPESWRDTQATIRVNVEGTSNICEAMSRRDHPGRLVFISSSEVYGRVRPGDLPVTERTELWPVTPYASSKAAAELVVRQAFTGRGIETVTARAFNHIGPGQSEIFVASALARRVVEAELSGRPSITVGNLNARRDFTDVRDVVRAYRSMAIDAVAGETYNVCSSVGRSIDEVAQSILRVVDAKVELVVDPDLVRAVEVEEIRGSYAKLQEATGWSPKWELDATFASVVAYWRERLHSS